jgi:hypothetical protein
MRKRWRIMQPAGGLPIAFRVPLHDADAVADHELVGRLSISMQIDCFHTRRSKMS